MISPIFRFETESGKLDPDTPLDPKKPETYGPLIRRVCKGKEEKEEIVVEKDLKSKFFYAHARSTRYFLYALHYVN